MFYNLIVPILVATKYRNASTDIQMSIYDDRVVNPLVTGEAGVCNLIIEVLKRFPNEPAVNPNWIISPYAPTPTQIYWRTPANYRWGSFFLHEIATSSPESLIGSKVELNQVKKDPKVFRL